MVKHPDIDKTQRRNQPISDTPVSCRRFRDTGRMVMRKDHSGRVQLQAPAHHLSRVHRGTVNSTEEQLFISYQSVLIIKKE